MVTSSGRFCGWFLSGAHHDHDPSVDAEVGVLVRLARDAVVVSQVALSFHSLVIAAENLEHHRRGGRKHLKQGVQSGRNRGDKP